MKRFKNILAIYDDAVGGDDALEQALALALANGARLTIATVLRENIVAPDVRRETGKRLDRFASSIQHAGLAEVTTRILSGTPCLEVIREVIRAGHDIVITSAEAGNSLRERFFGGTSTQLMRKCPCPVWVVKPGQPVPYTRIFAAVDPLSNGPDDELTIKIMDLAMSLAQRDRAVLHIVHAWDVDGSDLDTVRSEVPDGRRDEIVGLHRRKRESALDGLLSRYPLGDVDHRVHLPREAPEGAIKRLAGEESIDLIVMGTHARSSIPRLIVGTPFEAVMASVRCGMLTVKPDGFVSPVTLSDRAADGWRVGNASKEKELTA